MFNKNHFSNLCDKFAIITDQGNRYRYKDLLESAERISKMTKSRSLAICLANNTIGSLIGYISFLTSGIVPIMLNSDLDEEFLNQFIEIYKPSYIWQPFNKEMNNHDNTIIASEYDFNLIELKHGFKHKIHKNLALLLTTSGSTGSPKLVRITYNNLLANATSIADYLSINQNERPITVLPMHYSFGLSVINSHLLMGATILLTSKSIVEKDFWTFFKVNKATSISGIPYTFEILKKLKFFNMVLPSLKTITQAGGKLNDELNLEFSQFCKISAKKFFVMYGQTEATARMSYLPPKYSIEKIGSMGIAIPGGEFYLIDEAGKLIEKNYVIGELVYKGENVSMGYASCVQDLAKGDKNNGVLVTGDLAKRDRDGFYYIVGRKKRFIKLFGNRINLDETERLVKNVTPDVACSGSDDKMIIYITDEKLADDVKTYISEKTGINGQAYEVRVIVRIPKNSSGKTIYSQLPV